MAAANELVDRAVRTKQVSVRERGRAGGAFGHESREAKLRRDKEADRLRAEEEGRLAGWERAELLHAWSGTSDAVVRSAHGAIEDWLLRAPPRVGEELEREAVAFLLRRGKAGVARDRLVAILTAENVGATRHEARLTLRRLVGAGRVEFFVENELRKRPCTCKSQLGEFEGSSQGAPGAPRRNADCACGAGALEEVPTEMVRLLPGKHLRVVPRTTPEERWARADAELEAYCHTLTVSEDGASGGSRLPPGLGGGGEGVWAAVLSLGFHGRVIERVYGSGTPGPWSRVLSPEAARLAPLCPATERAREALVDARLEASGRRGDAEARESVDRSTYAVDAIRAKLDLAPAGEAAREKWSAERARYVVAVERESAKMLREAVEAYRRARGR